MMPPPEVFSLPVVLCPSCDHGIDPHGTDPGGICGVGDENAVRCECRWSPNDIAAKIPADLRTAVQGLTVRATLGSAVWVRLDHVTDLLNRRASL